MYICGVAENLFGDLKVIDSNPDQRNMFFMWLCVSPKHDIRITQNKVSRIDYDEKVMLREDTVAFPQCNASSEFRTGGHVGH